MGIVTARIISSLILLPYIISIDSYILPFWWWEGATFETFLQEGSRAETEGDNHHGRYYFTHRLFTHY